MNDLSSQSLQILGVLGTWFAGLGTFAAAGIALWIALRTRKVKLKCNVGLRTIVGGHGQRECLSVSVTNIGEGDVIIENLGWRIGRRGNRKYAIQILGTNSPHRFPKKLAHGERGTFMVNIVESSDWMQDLKTNFIKEAPIQSLRAEIYTSVGHTEIIKPEDRFLTALARIGRESAGAD